MSFLTSKLKSYICSCKATIEFSKSTCLLAYIDRSSSRAYPLFCHMPHYSLLSGYKRNSEHNSAPIIFVEMDRQNKLHKIINIGMTLQVGVLDPGATLRLL